MPRKRKPQTSRSVETLIHDEARRKNIPTAEYQSVMPKDEQSPICVAYQRRNRDLDPQLVWRGKDELDESDLVTFAPPLYIQEKVHPKVLIDDLCRQSVASEQCSVASGKKPEPEQFNLFADFNGIPEEADKAEFYQHDANWTNRMILGDSLQVMASLAEREGLRGQVQCIYLDPPYGIRFNSNFQWSTTSRDVKDGKAEHITREPEQVKAFRDTWRDGIHSYLTYLRDRLTVCRDLLTDSGSIFVQIGDENVHRVRMLMDEVFGEPNYVNTIVFKKKSSTTPTDPVNDFIVWYSKNRENLKIRPLFRPRKNPGEGSKMTALLWPDGRVLRKSEYDDSQIDVLLKNGAQWGRVDYPVVSQHPSETRSSDYIYRGNPKTCGPNKQWRFDPDIGLTRLERANRLFDGAGKSLGGVVYWNDWNQESFSNIWEDLHSENFPTYVVQTSTKVIERCMHLSTDPGDLILDPTCGSGTTAYVAEQWGRRWITIDTSRVALALARARIMGARYPFYLLADSPEGREVGSDRCLVASEKNRERSEHQHEPRATGHYPLKRHYSLKQGFVYERVSHITLKSIANNTEIDVIWEQFQEDLEPLREQLTEVVGEKWLVASRKAKKYAVELPNVIQEWEIPREPPSDWPPATHPLITAFWRQRIERQKAIDASIAAKADFEYLYDKPYVDKSKVRVAGPFTVESLSPHRVLGVDENDELIDRIGESGGGYGEERDFVQVILENLKTAGVQQAHKEDKIEFTSLTPWPGDLICAEGRVVASDQWLVNSVKGRSPSEHNPLTTSHNPQSTNH